MFLHEDPKSLWSRREYLRALGTTALVRSAFLAEGLDLRNKAKQNLKLAIFSSVYSALPLETAAQKIKQDGFAGVVTDFTFADHRFDPLTPDWDAARRIRNALESHGLKVAAIAAYYNVVDPDAERRKKGESRLGSYLAHWKRLGSPFICTETGTLNSKSEWMESPDNETESAYLQCRTRIQALVKTAEGSGAVLTIEPYWRNVINSVKRTQRLFSEIKSPALKVVMDPCNYYRNADLQKMQPILEEIFRQVGGRTVVAHAKDVKASADGPDLHAAGLGVLDYPLYLRLLAGLDRPLYLVLEHLGLEDVPRARDYVLKQFDRI
jgi:sugar phosphate isomerase/epimerase